MGSQNFGFDEGNGGKEITTPGRIKESIEQKARSFGHRAAERFDEATTRTGTKVESMGRNTRDRVTHAADALAERTESVGTYLQEHDFKAMADDVADVVRRYPVQSMMVGLGMGFLIGRMTSR